jgi:hypothetical protein
MEEDAIEITREAGRDNDLVSAVTAILWPETRVTMNRRVKRAISDLGRSLGHLEATVNR